MDDSDDGEHQKTVYAHFGLAIYMSQVLEHGLANALLVLDIVPRASAVATPESWPEKVDSFYDAQFKRTLGSLIHRLRELTLVPPELEQVLEQALETRNWLSHHYFRERAQRLGVRSCNQPNPNHESYGSRAFSQIRRPQPSARLAI